MIMISSVIMNDINERACSARSPTVTAMALFGISKVGLVESLPSNSN